jgi:hypothetical protein
MIFARLRRALALLAGALLLSIGSAGSVACGGNPEVARVSNALRERLLGRHTGLAGYEPEFTRGWDDLVIRGCARIRRGDVIPLTREAALRVFDQVDVVIVADTHDEPGPRRALAQLASALRAEPGGPGARVVAALECLPQEAGPSLRSLSVAVTHEATRDLLRHLRRYWHWPVVEARDAIVEMARCGVEVVPAGVPEDWSYDRLRGWGFYRLSVDIPDARRAPRSTWSSAQFRRYFELLGQKILDVAGSVRESQPDRRAARILVLVGAAHIVGGPAHLVELLAEKGLLAQVVVPFVKEWELDLLDRSLDMWGEEWIEVVPGVFRWRSNDVEDLLDADEARLGARLRER